jgi:DNA-binding response OmpR family regulator
MTDAWIYPCQPGLGEALAGDLAELGYSAHRLAVDGDLQGGREALAPAREAVASRPPALVVVTSGASQRTRASELCAALRALEELSEVPLLLALELAALGVDGAPPDGDELLVAPWSVAELRARIERANQRLGLADEGDIVRVGGLELNLATYQVTIDGTPVDFTYMEYELLRFLVTHPNRVFSREALLSRVWGYDFYGGTRTVDVHVRRVRAKLGAEHAARIRTVRSVGYRFER